MGRQNDKLKEVIYSLTKVRPWNEFKSAFYNYVLEDSESRFIIIQEYQNTASFISILGNSTVTENEYISKIRNINEFWKIESESLKTVNEYLYSRDNSPFLKLLLVDGNAENKDFWDFLLKLQSEHFINIKDQDEEIVFASKSMLRILSDADKIAKTEASVLITGESGTGKELIAKRLHRMSSRSEFPFISINCAAITETLLETELFGYKAGSFTGADKDTPGKLSQAKNGTLFLDEIGEMSSAFQAKLLRFLDTGEYSPVGDIKILKSDIRIISATNRDIEKDVNAGHFRNDLYYRIGVCKLALSPIRDRQEDIKALVDYFLPRYSSRKDSIEFTPEAWSLLLNYEWPGNVRELKNVINRILTLTENAVIDDVQISDAIGIKMHSGMSVKSLKEAVNLFKKRLIHSTLGIYNDNRTLTAKALGIQRTYLIKLIEDLNIEKIPGIKE